MPTVERTVEPIAGVMKRFYCRVYYSAAHRRVNSGWASTLELAFGPTLETRIGANSGVSHWSITLEPHRESLQRNLTWSPHWSPTLKHHNGASTQHSTEHSLDYVELWEAMVRALEQN